LVESEIINDKQNPTRKINFAREEIDIKPFTDEQIKKMLGYLRRRKQRQKFFVTVRDYTMIVFLLGTGVRLGELINLKWSDVDLINGTASILGKKGNYHLYR
jgi:integrase/recombinase XerD